MWSYAVTRASTRRASRSLLRTRSAWWSVASTVPVVGTTFDVDDDKRHCPVALQRRELSDGGAGGGRGGQGSGGSGRSWGPPRDNRTGGRRGNKRENFDRSVLQPASKGELTKKHSSGIPKLASRKHKPNLAAHPPGRRSRNHDIRFSVGEQEEEAEMDMDFPPLPSPRPMQGISSGMLGEPTEQNAQVVANRLHDDNVYYWKEEDFDTIEAPEGDEDEGVGMEASDGGDKQKAPEEGGGGEQRASDSNKRRSRGRNDNEDQADEDSDPILDQMSILKVAEMDIDQFPDVAQQDPIEVLPLAPFGPDSESFVRAMGTHPSRYAQVVHENLHPESRREPKPDFPPNKVRANPSQDFVNKYHRFLYVTGLLPTFADGETGDINNPVHRSLLQTSVAQLVDVDSERVFPANMTSGFVGFDNNAQLWKALANGPKESVAKSAVLISGYEPADGDPSFATDSPETVVHIGNLPAGYSSAWLAANLFPEGTEVGHIYSGLTKEDIHFRTPNGILVRFSTKEQAESAISSERVHARLAELGASPIQYFRARRELVHAGWIGPTRGTEARIVGPRLIVDGDMPTKKFYIRHARVLQFRGLDHDVTKEEITEAVQPFCVQLRDVESSVEFVTCHEGRPTGRAYVGFDLPGEAEITLRACKGGHMTIRDRKVTVKLMKDRRIPGQAPLDMEKRPERPVDELLDDLNNWEKFVDPADIEILEQHGINKIVLNEALRGIRFHNPTFGPLDHSLRSEAYEPDKMRGEQYQELVEMYIATLKECIATPDNVGQVYEALHFEGEPIDTSPFDNEVERQKMITEQRS